MERRQFLKGMVKVDLITGFLGSGKTTFIKKYAQYLMDCGCNIGILENDFGAVNVDMMLLGDLTGEKCELEMVAGGCDADCHRRRFKTKLISMGMCGYDRVIVEPSGIYEVDEFFDVLHEEPLDRWYEIGNVITLVNSKLEDALSTEADYLLAAQCANAGKILLSRSEEATDEECERTLAHINRALREVQCKREFRGFGEEVLLKGTDGFTEEEFERISRCGYVPEYSCRKPDFKQEDVFETLYLMNVSLPEDAVRETVEGLMHDAGCGGIFRIKGFLKQDEEHWLELNATRDEIRIAPIAKGQEVVIVIGEGLNEEAIRARLGAKV